MLKISIITVFPELYDIFIKTSLIGRAVQNGLIEFNLIKFSDMCSPKERIDESTVGPGAGMIIKPEIIERSIEHCQKKSGPGFKVFFSPQGTQLTQNILRKLYVQLTSATEQSPSSPQSQTLHQHLILICARYEGIDERIEEYYSDVSISIGDYILMGGDLPAQVFLESFLRLFHGVIGRSESVKRESFQCSLLDHPEYGLPVEWKGMIIPEVLRSGNHAEIEKWRKAQACKKTILNRFDWFRKTVTTEQDMELCRKNIPAHYILLMHSHVNTKDNNSGNTSVASIDIHDIARSSTTYGIKKYFLVTELDDQFKIIETFLKFWQSDIGKNYNQSRYEAVSRVSIAKTLDDVIIEIEKQDGKKPVIITTSAKNHLFGQQIDYYSQSQVWKLERPVLIILGTGQGLNDEIMRRSDFILGPVIGMTNYNHLSVRSAAAIILDRWLGINQKN